MNYDVLIIVVSLFMILLGFFLLVIYSLSRSLKSDIKTGGFILVGPIPIVFSNDKRLGFILIIAGIVLTSLAILLFLISLLR